MDEDLVASFLLLVTALLWASARYGLISPLLLREIWPAILIIAGLYYLYLHLKGQDLER